MAYLNKCFLIGNLGKDPEIRIAQNGNKQAKFSIATTQLYKDKNTGENKQKTDWHNVVAWNSPAEQIERLAIKKGTSIFIEGRISQRSWDDPSGQKRYSTEIEIERFQLLVSKPQTQENSGSNYSAPAQEYPDAQTQDDLPF